MADLKGRSVRGGAITLAAQAIKFLLLLTNTVVLARLLTPADFGLVAMVTSVTGLVGMFKDLGLALATVQRADITHTQVSMLFWINVSVSGMLMLGPNWMQVAALFLLLGPAAITLPILVIPGWVCISTGTVWWELRWCLAFVPLFAAAFLVGGDCARGGGRCGRLRPGQPGDPYRRLASQSVSRW